MSKNNDSDVSTDDVKTDFINNYSGLQGMDNNDADFIKDFLINKKWKFSKHEKQFNNEKFLKAKEERKKAIVTEEEVKKYNFSNFEDLLNNLNKDDCCFEYQSVEKESFGFSDEEIFKMEESEIDKKFYKKIKKAKKENDFESKNSNKENNIQKSDIDKKNEEIDFDNNNIIKEYNKKKGNNDKKKKEIDFDNDNSIKENKKKKRSNENKSKETDTQNEILIKKNKNEENDYNNITNKNRKEKKIEQNILSTVKEIGSKKFNDERKNKNNKQKSEKEKTSIDDGKIQIKKKIKIKKLDDMKIENN
ncbi:hypothetical protein GVAV_000102 [Gurleya vavrai]